MTYEISKDTKQTVTELKNYAKKADYVYLATDADREGECIFRYVYNLVKPDKPVKNGDKLG